MSVSNSPGYWCMLVPAYQGTWRRSDGGLPRSATLTSESSFSAFPALLLSLSTCISPVFSHVPHLPPPIFFFSFSFFFCSFPSHHRALSSLSSSFFFPASKLDFFAPLILSLSSFQIYCHYLNLFSLLYNMKNISIHTVCNYRVFYSLDIYNNKSGWVGSCISLKK